MRDELLAPDRMRAIQEELAAFFLDHVIAEDGEYYVDHASEIGRAHVWTPVTG